KIDVAPLPANFLAEASRIKSTRSNVVSFEERLVPRHEERRHHRGGGGGQRGRYASAVKPMGSSRRRASRG
ncbi:MAG TPA: ATP-dependent helicase, partial [Allosphingosinicella sp.]|nr:ATP-dependent helicase [Allosphingosinicella sp.]